MSDESPQRPLPEGYTSWQAYWQAHGQPWRTEPEIGEARQRSLRAWQSQPRDSPYDFQFITDFRLSRADVEWLLGISSGGSHPTDGAHQDRQVRAEVDLRGADLGYVDLSGLPLGRLHGGLRDEDLDDGWRVPYDDGDPAAVREVEIATVHAAVHLERAYLTGTQLQEASLHGAHLEGAYLDFVHWERADLCGAHLEGAYLRGTHLEGANLEGAHLEGAHLDRAHLEGARLWNAHLEGKRILRADLDRIRRHHTDFLGALRDMHGPSAFYPSSETLPPADLKRAFLDSTTELDGAVLGDRKYGFVSVADVHWGDANLAVLQWLTPTQRIFRWRPQGTVLGDEQAARQQKRPARKPEDVAVRLADYETAVRANRQVATSLRSQGMNEEADYFAYRAQELEREVLHCQGRYLRWLWQCVLGALAGYGYRPLRTAGWYMLLLALSTLIYAWQSYVILHACSEFCSPQEFWQAAVNQPGALGQAFVQAITALHGRGFFPLPHATGWEMGTAAFDAVAGLIIEASFVATFVQRFFAR